MSQEKDVQFLSGFQPVLEALRHRRRPLFSLLISRKKGSEELTTHAEDAGVQIKTATAEKVGQLAGTSKHQGVVLECGQLPTFSLEELLRFEPADGRDLLVLLAGVEDPRNLGAVARTCSFLGVRALVLPSKGTAPLSPTASRSSAGALESFPVAFVKSAPIGCNLLSEAGYEVVGVEMGGEPLSRFREVPGRTALVLGSEDRALPPRVRAACSKIVTIEGEGPTGSLNLSVAAGIAIYHVVSGGKTTGRLSD
ncbi:RNA methyltransferase [bacterium]|nr:RNA methyltransferase [bacterium]